MATNYIYIMTDSDVPAGNAVIGYTDDIDARLQLVNGPAVVGTYIVYATYKVPVKLQYDHVQMLLDALFPNKRKGRELFDLTAEEAYAVLEAAAAISGTADNLTRGVQKVGTVPAPEQLTLSEPTEKKVPQKPWFNFRDCGIPVGAELVYTLDSRIRVTVADYTADEKNINKVWYKGKLYNLSPLVKELKGCPTNPSGTRFFTYNGELLLNIVERTQWTEWRKQHPNQK